MVAAAVADAWRLLGIGATTELSSWAGSYLPTRQDESKLALHTRADKTFAAQALSTLIAMPRLRDKAAYVRALMLPDAQYVAAGTLPRSPGSGMGFAKRDAVGPDLSDGQCAQRGRVAHHPTASARSPRLSATYIACRTVR